jgi:hypothetical protein
MIAWIRRLFIKYAVKYVKKQINHYEESNNDLAEFHRNLYELPIANFMRYCTVTLGKKNGVPTKEITFIEYLKKLIAPLDDRYEKIIIQIIDGLMK